MKHPNFAERNHCRRWSRFCRALVHQPLSASFTAASSRLRASGLVQNALLFLPLPPELGVSLLVAPGSSCARAENGANTRLARISSTIHTLNRTAGVDVS